VKRKYKREMDNYYDISEYYVEKTMKSWVVKLLKVCSKLLFFCD